MDKLRITAIVCTQNEELVIERTLGALQDFDQLILVDSASTDNTCALAEKCGAEVVHHTWNGKYPKKKQCALELPQIKNDWVLFIDADEVPSPALMAELRTREPELAEKKYGGYEIPLAYHFLGRKLEHGYTVTKRSLIDRHRAAYPVVDDLAVTNMWEIEGHYQPDIDGPIGWFSANIEHNDIDPLYDYFRRHNFYSDWEAYIRLNPAARRVVRGSRSPMGRIWDLVPLKPVLFFFYAYVVRGGFRDGAAGFHYAMANIFYYWQIAVKVKEAKLAAVAARNGTADRP